MVRDPANDAEFFFLRPKDIATYAGRELSTRVSPA